MYSNATARCWTVSCCGRKTSTRSLKGWNPAQSATRCCIFRITRYPASAAGLATTSFTRRASINGLATPPSRRARCAAVPFKHAIAGGGSTRTRLAFCISTQPISSTSERQNLILPIYVPPRFDGLRHVRGCHYRLRKGNRDKGQRGASQATGLSTGSFGAA